MNKKELATVVVLILLIPVWLFVDATFIKPRFPDPEPVSTPVSEEVLETEEPRLTPPGSAPVIVPEDAVAPAVPVLVTEDSPDAEAQTAVLENELLRLELSTLGAAVERVTLKAFPDSLEEKYQEDGQAVVLDFSDAGIPALSLSLPGFTARAGFGMEQVDDATVRFRREVQDGLVLVREITLGEGYLLNITDRWQNGTSVVMQLPEQNLSLGPMEPRPEASQRFGPFVGVDAQHPGTGVKHYVKQLTKGLKNSSDGTFSQQVAEPFYWFSVKNKFFTQVLTFEINDLLTPELLDMQAAAGEGDIKIAMAQASARLAGVTLPAGEQLQRNYSYYVGPMEMSVLRELGANQEGLIDLRLFRIFVPLGKIMMTGLNALHGVVNNWGVAIILLTFVVRMLFWPLTQKGAENMKRMSELSPQMKDLREKYKNDPQKLNAEMSKFYKENKVNPMAGCLPMLVQIPVFISLYGVLRVAVQLRFAEFLWIKDLSEPEQLFMIGGFAVNILPLTMGATMVLQQKLTPSNMDEQQKKIMMMMPIVFLFITYSMPSGLLLYWTTSNLISIYQTTHTRKRDAKKAAAKDAAGKRDAAARAKPVTNPKAKKK